MPCLYRRYIFIIILYLLLFLSSSYLSIALLVQQDVLQLEIAMADLVLVTVVDGGGHLAEDASRLLLGENLPFRQIVVELAASGKFHD